MKTDSIISADTYAPPFKSKKEKIEALPKSTLSEYQDIALVLQGGGALGSYQAGVYEALAERGINPTWIAGISIGALNTAIIAGNPPEKRVEKLKAFWDTICESGPTDPMENMFSAWTSMFGDAGRKALNGMEAHKTMLHGQKGFFIPRFMALMPFNKFQKNTPDKISYYDTSKLKETLLKFADFDLINNGSVRVSLGVVNVQSGEFSYFDNTKQKLTPEHFMASGALPPSFPAVEIEGQFYWDGGLVSNTPVTEVLHENKKKDTLVFQIDLWNSSGKLPENFDDIKQRTHDIQFSSRNKAMHESIAQQHEQATMMKELLAQIPESIRKNNPWCQKAAEMAKEGALKIVQLIYQNKPYEGASKAYEFSPLTMHEHWDSGLSEMRANLNKKEWNLPPVKVAEDSLLQKAAVKTLNTIEQKIEEIRHQSTGLGKNQYRF